MTRKNKEEEFKKKCKWRIPRGKLQVLEEEIKKACESEDL